MWARIERRLAALIVATAFVCSACGRKEKSPQRASAAPPDGAKLYAQHCATCHMADGSGVPNLQPAIIGSGWIAQENPEQLVRLILRGSPAMGAAAEAYDNQMAPFAETLNDREIAVLTTYLRAVFAEPALGPVSPDRVAIVRRTAL
jgi:mono/diheme cytochrome c family protein